LVPSDIGGGLGNNTVSDDVDLGCRRRLNNNDPPKCSWGAVSYGRKVSRRNNSFRDQIGLAFQGVIDRANAKRDIRWSALLLNDMGQFMGQ
jgi:hypothetical protein